MEAEAGAGSQYLVAAMSNRSAIYNFLSRMYEKEITTELLKEMIDEKSPILRVEGLQEIPDDELKNGLEKLRKYLEGLKERDLEEARLELAVEYANLFLGIKGKPPHPSESAYRSEDHLIMQEPMDEVLHAYWDAGVNKDKKFTEPADHIAVELQFMAYLCRKTAEALGRNEKDNALKYLKMQKDFLRNHLSLWISPFVKDILDTAEVDFYKGIAIITKRFVELDNSMIDDLLKAAEEL